MADVDMEVSVEWESAKMEVATPRRRELDVYLRESMWL